MLNLFNSPAFAHDARDRLLIIQCDLGHLYGDLIACARYRVDDEREKANLQRRPGQGTTHVLFIIHLPRRGVDKDKESSSFVGFQGGAWISAYIDDIRAPTEAALTLDEALSAPISELFYNIPFISSRVELQNIEISEEFNPKQNDYEEIEEEALQQIESDLPPSEIMGLEFIQEDMPVEEMQETKEQEDVRVMLIGEIYINLNCMLLSFVL